MRSSDREPLSGIRVLDLCRVVSGPFATMQLGDLGADIVKVEDPRQGDESRRYGPPFIGGESAYFLSVNRNKRSCAIDLKSPAGCDAVLELASVADVVIENFRPGTLDKWGLGFDALRARKGDIILCSISGFGRTGADAGRPGYDLILQGESGVMDITGDPDGPPTKVGTSIADLVTGLYASQSVLAALMRKSRTGEGGRVDVSMLDAMASLLTFNAGMYFASGESPKRRGNVHPTISPYEPFETSDGWINVGVANDKFWMAFCDVIGRPDLIEDISFATAPKRAASRNELVAILSPIFASKTRRLAAVTRRSGHSLRRDQVGRRSLRDAATHAAGNGPDRQPSGRGGREVHRQADPVRR
nr:CoA transferase [Bradyrhizobium sp. th.b2]